MSTSFHIHFGGFPSEVSQPTDSEHHITPGIAKYIKLVQKSTDDFNNVYTKIQLALDKFSSKSIVNADNYNASLLNEDCNCYCECPKPMNTSHKLMSDIKERVYALREKIRNVGNMATYRVYLLLAWFITSQHTIFTLFLFLNHGITYFMQLYFICVYSAENYRLDFNFNKLVLSNVITVSTDVL